MTLGLGRYVIALFGVGILDHSIALIAMGIHVISDVVSYIIALWLHLVVQRPGFTSPLSSYSVHPM